MKKPERIALKDEAKVPFWLLEVNSQERIDLGIATLPMPLVSVWRKP